MALNPYEKKPERFHRITQMSRRQFLGFMGTIGAVGATLFGSVELLNFMFPAATGEEPPEFKTSFKVTDLTPSAPVQTITAKRVSVIMDNAGIYAVYLVCTHLGCTPNYASDVANDISQAEENRALGRGVRGNDQLKPGATAVTPQANGWKCPCHGSRYFIDSTNFYGPAPRPMDWVHVEVTPDGHLFIDRSKLVAYRQPGDQTAPKWRLAQQPDGSWKDNGKTLGA